MLIVCMTLFAACDNLFGPSRSDVAGTYSFHASPTSVAGLQGAGRFAVTFLEEETGYIEVEGTEFEHVNFNWYLDDEDNIVAQDGRGGPVTYEWRRSYPFGSREIVQVSDDGGPEMVFRREWFAD